MTDWHTYFIWQNRKKVTPKTKFLNLGHSSFNRYLTPHIKHFHGIHSFRWAFSSKKPHIFGPRKIFFLQYLYNFLHWHTDLVDILFEKTFKFWILEKFIFWFLCHFKNFGFCYQVYRFLVDIFFKKTTKFLNSIYVYSASSILDFIYQVYPFLVDIFFKKNPKFLDFIYAYLTSNILDFRDLEVDIWLTFSLKKNFKISICAYSTSNILDFRDHEVDHVVDIFNKKNPNFWIPYTSISLQTFWTFVILK